MTFGRSIAGIGGRKQRPVVQAGGGASKKVRFFI